MFFKLPDLGEGLQEAEVVEWHVRAGDAVTSDQRLVSVETAKAIVDIPSPQAGIIDKLILQVGEMAHIGEPLLAYKEAFKDDISDQDTATVVGELPTQVSAAASSDDFIVGAAQHNAPRPKNTAINTTSSSASNLPTAEHLKGPRRTMAKVMSSSRANVAAATLMDDADLSGWPNGTDTSARLCRAIACACRQVPVLNAHFDGNTLSRQLHQNVNLGIAVDSSDGLFVPIITSLEKLDLAQIRVQLDNFKHAINKRSISPKEMQGATIALSNFGVISSNNSTGKKGGRYGSPIIVPPQVAIIGAGRISLEAAVIEDKVQPRLQLPLSLSFDHRCVTGAEASRFLAAMIFDLEKSD
jgi:pyruvate dehydrogenase E2 component (dihydrolipoamide acetyltransferase)